MKRKQILYVSAYDPSVPMNGASVRGQQFVNRLGAHFDLDLVAFEGVGHAPAADVKRRFANLELRVRSRAHISFTHVGYFLFDPRMYRALRQRLARGRYDWIFCDYGLAVLYGLLLGRRADTPMVYSSHNVEHQLYRDKVDIDWRRLPLSYYVEAVEKAGARRADLLIAISREDAATYARWTTQDKILVVPQGFDAALYNPHYHWQPAPRPIVLFCGDFGSPANRDAVHQAVAVVLDDVVRRHPEVRFRFVGAAPPCELARPNVEFPGFVDDYPGELKRADVVISPVRIGGGSPTKVVEALACGKPVVATPVGARTLERDYRALEVCGIEAFAARINALLERRPGVVGHDFERLHRRYEWGANIDRLAARMQARPQPVGAAR